MTNMHFFLEINAGESTGWLVKISFTSGLPAISVSYRSKASLLVKILGFEVSRSWLVKSTDYERSLSVKGKPEWALYVERSQPGQFTRPRHLMSAAATGYLRGKTRDLGKATSRQEMEDRSR
ncbi:hypothetical protein HZH68_003348 [Vespula germanica]|uniref:Uncharacterized protein n=3 Tax=Vespula TaxID=7451 RepID=A0A834NNZ6_VESGE|nr:hypothetical protein HZH68_003348 [Vespula germanica]KAF7435517.1 hypothetical protein H0235_003708 [Vespula pensylvanica]